MQSTRLGSDTGDALKKAVVQPSLLLSPFLPFEQQQATLQALDDLVRDEDNNHNGSFEFVANSFVGKDGTLSREIAVGHESSEINRDLEVNE